MPTTPEPEADAEDTAVEWLTRLDVVVRTFDQMKPRERAAALGYLKARHRFEWPTDPY